MHWKVELPIKPRSAINFCKEHLREFDVKNLKYIRFRPGRDGFIIYGHCTWHCPDDWYISTCLPGPFPGKIFLEYGGELMLNSLDEGFVWIYGHEIYHYLIQSKQLKGKDDEISADRYAKRLYDKYLQ